jgi:hypothetical protein
MLVSAGAGQHKRAKLRVRVTDLVGFKLSLAWSGLCPVWIHVSHDAQQSQLGVHIQRSDERRVIVSA